MNPIYPEFTIGDYHSDGDLLGQGGFAVVFKGYHVRTSDPVAIRYIRPEKYHQEKLIKQLEKEIEIMKSLDHPNIIKLFEVFYDSHTYLIMEYADSGNLEEYVRANGGRLSEDKSKYFLQHLAKGLDYLRILDIIHRDLKPENLLLHQDQTLGDLILKIGDFGLARSMDGLDDLAQTHCGTNQYMAPEIYFGVPYSYKADLWSVGVILYRLVTGTLPLKGVARPSQNNYDNIDTVSLYSLVSTKCKYFIVDLLQPVPEDRISWDEFISHSFLKNENENEFEIDDIYLDEHYSVVDIENMTNSTTLRSENSSSKSYSYLSQKENTKKMNLSVAISNLADSIKDTHPKEAFVIYVSVVHELMEILKYSPKNSSTENIRGSAKLRLTETKVKAKECRNQFTSSEMVDSLSVILFNHSMTRAIEAAEDELNNEREKSGIKYRNSILCLQYLESIEPGLNENEPSLGNRPTLKSHLDALQERLDAVQNSSHSI